METNNINGIVFLRSYVEAITDLDKNDRLEMYDAIVNYGFFNEEPTFENKYLNSIWKMMKPNLDNSIKRYSTNIENGKKGGRPKKSEETITSTRIEDNSSNVEEPTKEEIIQPVSSIELKINQMERCNIEDVFEEPVDYTEEELEEVVTEPISTIERTNKFFQQEEVEPIKKLINSIQTPKVSKVKQEVIEIITDEEDYKEYFNKETGITKIVSGDTTEYFYNLYSVGTDNYVILNNGTTICMTNTMFNYFNGLSESKKENYKNQSAKFVYQDLKQKMTNSKNHSSFMEV